MWFTLGSDSNRRQAWIGSIEVIEYELLEGISYGKRQFTRIICSRHGESKLAHDWVMFYSINLEGTMGVAKRMFGND